MNDIDKDLGLDESTVPNGMILRHTSGSPAYIPIDDNGKLYGDVSELSITDDWKKSKMPDDTILLVHSITSEDKMLTKRLFRIKIEIEDKVGVSSVWELLTSKRLQKVMDDIWKNYMDGKLVDFAKFPVGTKKG